MMTSLSKTQRRLERWRSQHKKKSRLALSLKSEAVGLLEQYSPREVAKALGISTYFRAQAMLTIEIPGRGTIKLSVITKGFTYLAVQKMGSITFFLPPYLIP